MTPIKLQGVRKHFGSTKAVDGIDLEIPAGDLFFLLGPSGCGKTTLLRMVAGFTLPTDGRIYFGDQDVTEHPTNQRDTGMVFQGYALWPHMTVFQNVEFGLTVGKRKGQFSAADRKAKVTQALGVVQIDQYADRKINQLSGGQQQRVALARALVIEPSVLLLDEPLSNLDAKLRLEMRQEIRRICKEAGITGVYVTHDQKEALSMADGVAVLNAGKLVQAGTPRQLYERPGSRFVADFLGESNFLPARVQSVNGRSLTLDTPAGPLTSAAFPEGLNVGTNVTVSIRPEALHAAGPEHPHNPIAASRARTVYLGEMAQYRMQVNDSTTLKMFELNPRLLDHQAGGIKLTVDPRDVVVLQDGA